MACLEVGLVHRSEVRQVRAHEASSVPVMALQREQVRRTAVLGLLPLTSLAAMRVLACLARPWKRAACQQRRVLVQLVRQGQVCHGWLTAVRLRRALLVRAARSAAWAVRASEATGG